MTETVFPERVRSVEDGSLGRVSRTDAGKRLFTVEWDDGTVSVESMDDGGQGWIVERKRDYSTARENGMEFIANRWVFAGDKGFRVKPDGGGAFRVVSYAHTSERPVPGGVGLTEDAAHELAARLARRD